MERPNPQYLEISPQDLEKIARRREQDESTKVDPEWRLLAEFGDYYGWSAIQAVRNNEIDIDTFNGLLAGGRKVWAGKILDLSTMVFGAVAAANSKKPQTVLTKVLKNFYKEVKI